MAIEFYFDRSVGLARFRLRSPARDSTDDGSRNGYRVIELEERRSVEPPLGTRSVPRGGSSRIPEKAHAWWVSFTQFYAASDRNVAIESTRRRCDKADHPPR
jgi:hypothetical protein